PNMVATSRALQMIHSESERQQAYETRKRVINMIGDLARDKLADRVEDDTAPLLGTPDEVIARLKELEAGGATNILLVDPNASVGNLRAFAREVMPAFTPAPAAAAAERPAEIAPAASAAARDLREKVDEDPQLGRKMPLRRIEHGDRCAFEFVVLENGAHVAAPQILAVEPPCALRDAAARHHGLAQHVAAVDHGIAADPDRERLSILALEAPFGAEAADQAIVLQQILRCPGLAVALQIGRRRHRDLRAAREQTRSEPG